TCSRNTRGHGPPGRRPGSGRRWAGPRPRARPRGARQRGTGRAVSRLIPRRASPGLRAGLPEVGRPRVLVLVEGALEELRRGRRLAVEAPDRERALLVGVLRQVVELAGAVELVALVEGELARPGLPAVARIPGVDPRARAPLLAAQLRPEAAPVHLQ